jgi:hypothetical protein
LLTAEVFSTELRKRLKLRYGRLPSAAFVALHFNGRVSEYDGISQETARRWMRGVSIPRYTHFGILSDWLKLDINSVFDSANNTSSARDREGGSDVFAEETIKITRLINGLSPKKRENLLEFLSTMAL